MSPPSNASADLILGDAPRAASLLDAVDRLLNVGAVAAGEATIAVAGVDLIYLGLNLVLSSVETLQAGAGGPARGDQPRPPGTQPGSPTMSPGPSSPTPAAEVAVESTEGDAADHTRGASRAKRRPPAAPVAPTGPRLDLDPNQVEQGLAKLVLTLVEFLRQLLERQAIRRMDGGRLSDEEIERMGAALLQLRAKLWEMAEQFGLRPEDLNLDLGPLGNLL